MTHVPPQSIEQPGKQNGTQQSLVRSERIADGHRLRRVHPGRGQSFRRNEMRGPRLAEPLRAQALAKFFRIVMAQIRRGHIRRKPAQTRGHAVDPGQTDDFFDQVDFAGQIRTETRHRPPLTRFHQTQPLQNHVDVAVSNIASEQRSAAIVVQSHRCSGDGRLSRNQHFGFGSSTRDLQNELRGPRGSGHHALRINAPLEAVTRIGRDPEFARSFADARRIEPCAFEQQIGRGIGHAGFRPAHHPGQGDRLLRVGNDQIVGPQFEIRTIQGGKPLAFARIADDDAALQFAQIERVQGLAGFHQHVIRNVDHIVDRTKPDRRETIRQPLRTRTDFHPANDPCSVKRTSGILQFYKITRGFFGWPCGFRRFCRFAGYCPDFAGHAQQAQKVRTVRRDFEFHHGVRGKKLLHRFSHRRVGC